MPGSFSLAGLRSLGLEEDDKAEVKLEPAVEGRLRVPPPAKDAEPSPGPSPLPPLRFLPDTGKGEVEAALLAELCLLSGKKDETRVALKHNSKYDVAMSQKRLNKWEHKNLPLTVVSRLPQQQICSICDSCQSSLK